MDMLGALRSWLTGQPRGGHAPDAEADPRGDPRDGVTPPDAESPDRAAGCVQPPESSELADDRSALGLDSGIADARPGEASGEASGADGAAGGDAPERSRAEPRDHDVVPSDDGAPAELSRSPDTSEPSDMAEASESVHTDDPVCAELVAGDTQTVDETAMVGDDGGASADVAEPVAEAGLSAVDSDSTDDSAAPLVANRAPDIGDSAGDPARDVAPVLERDVSEPNPWANAAAPAPDPIVAARQERLAGRILDDEGLRADLTDDEYAPLLAWALGATDRLASATAGLDDGAAEDVLDAGVGAVKSALRIAGDIVVAGNDGDAARLATTLDELARASASLPGSIDPTGLAGAIHALGEEIGAGSGLTGAGLAARVAGLLGQRGATT